MKKLYSIIAVVLISYTSFSQDIKDSAAISNPVNAAKSHEPIFTRAEKMPKLIGGVKALEDNLFNSLSDYKPESNVQGLRYQLTISKEGQVKECVPVSRPKNKIFRQQLESLLKRTSGMWEPALQNGHQVTAIKTINIDYEDGIFHVKELD